MDHCEVTLNDKYDFVEGLAYMTGIQALVRLPFDQRRLDRAAGYNTAGFISGYRGSPLGGYDQQLRAAQARLDAHDIVFWEGLNEDLGATAVWGSQQLGVFPGAQKDGVFGIWYGKAPGVDRTGDVFKHANFAGTSALGGVLAIVGDDHMCKSSTLPSQSEFALADAEIPILNPASIQDVLDYGIHGWAMSRYSGTWTGMVALADTMDSGAVVDVSLKRFDLLYPGMTLPEGGLHLRGGDIPMEKEHRLRAFKIPAAQAYVRANCLDRVILPARQPRVGIVVTGQAARDIFEAMAAIGLTPQQASDLGISIFKVAMPWPLEPQAIRSFSSGLERILVLEHKRPLIEDQLRSVLYDLPDTDRPYIEGKRTRSGAPLLPDYASITVPEFAEALLHVLPETFDRTVADAYFERVGRARDASRTNASPTVRSPHYCSGCPHNTSTHVPDGSRALAGIGCHYMATFMPERKTDMHSQMGGEGIAWIGQSPFTDEAHVFVNLGDGTYSHSGSLAIRAALTGNANITYKVLYNDAVAMTGGQHVESGQTVPQIARQVEAEGVKTIAVVTEDVTRYANVKDLPRLVTVHDRKDLEEVQLRMRETKGVSVIIYDQVCATEKRRRIKRSKLQDKNIRVLINPDVCEGCGDCSVRSSCLSVEPVETEFGRKRRINQSTCNTDLSCVNGFCPSFVTVKGGVPVATLKERASFDASGLPIPETPSLTRPWNLVFTGVGGTGVTTTAAILAMAAHVDGNASSALDMTGLAQKGGPVLSHVRFAKTPEAISTGRVPPASADAIIACDLVVAASGGTIVLMDDARTRAVANTDITPTSEFIRNRRKTFEADLLSTRVKRQTQAFNAINAEALAVDVLNDAIYTNMIMTGFAWQNGLIPITLRGLYRAIKLNGVKIEENMAAFDLGRLAAADSERLPEIHSPRDEIKPRTLDELIDHRAGILTRYQNAAYAEIYKQMVASVRASETAAGLGETLTRAVAKFGYKVMAYKDEYEVARLFTDGRFEQTLRNTFSGDPSIRFHLAPPLMAKKDMHGHLVKKPFGKWMFRVFRILKHLKGLRGTRFDVFGYCQERKAERALRDTYIENAARLARELTHNNHALAVAIASIPDEIRGYGHVKEKAMDNMARVEADLWKRWPKGGALPATTTLIG